MRSGLSGVILLGGLVLPGAILLCQDKPEPPKREVRLQETRADSIEEERLPKIALPEFEITGNEVVSAGDGSKGEPDAHWSVRSTTLSDPGQRESSGTVLGDPSLAGLPAGVQGISGRVEGRFGSFRTPMFDLWLGASSLDVHLLLKSGYASSSGHVAYADYRKGYVSLSAGHYLSNETSILGMASIHGDIGFRGHAFKLYGSDTPDRQRTLGQFEISAGAKSRFDLPFRYDANVSLRSFSMLDERRSEETEFGLNVAAESNLHETYVRASLELWRDFYSVPSSDQDPFWNSLSLTAQRKLLDRVQLVGGAVVYFLRGSDGGSFARAYPRAAVLWQAGDRLNLFARYEPHIARLSIFSLVEQNPYNANDPAISHPEYQTNFLLGAEIDPDPALRAKITFSYQRVRNHPFFADPAQQGVWIVEYSGTARVLGFEGECSFDLTPESRLSGSIVLRDVQNTETGAVLPYSRPVQVSAVYRHTLPIRITLGTRLQIVGSQYIDLDNTRTLPAFAVWGSSAEYETIPRLVIGLAVENLLGTRQERWEGYSGLPRVATLFARYGW